MLRRVTLVRTDVSEELSASFIRVTRIGELGTTLELHSHIPTEMSGGLGLLIRAADPTGHTRWPLAAASFPGTDTQADSLCGLLVRVPGYRSRGPGFCSRRYQMFCVAVGLEQGPL
jgi:hypothetical protein